MGNTLDIQTSRRYSSPLKFAMTIVYTIGTQIVLTVGLL